MYSSFRSLVSRPLRAVGLALAAGALLLAGCGTPPQSTSKSTARQIKRPAQNANLGWVGSYRTNAPCPLTGAPGCTSQTLMLMLNPDNTYSLTTTTYRRSGAPYSFTSRARFRWDGRDIVLASKDENARLRVNSNGTLERIGADGLTQSEAARTPLVFRKL